MADLLNFRRQHVVSCNVCDIPLIPDEESNGYLCHELRYRYCNTMLYKKSIISQSEGVAHFMRRFDCYSVAEEDLKEFAS